MILCNLPGRVKRVASTTGRIDEAVDGWVIHSRIRFLSLGFAQPTPQAWSNALRWRGSFALMWQVEDELRGHHMLGAECPQQMLRIIFVLRGHLGWLSR